MCKNKCVTENILNSRKSLILIEIDNTKLYYKNYSGQSFVVPCQQYNHLLMFFLAMIVHRMPNIHVYFQNLVMLFIALGGTSSILIYVSIYVNIMTSAYTCTPTLH